MGAIAEKIQDVEEPTPFQKQIKIQQTTFSCNRNYCNNSVYSRPYP